MNNITDIINRLSEIRYDYDLEEDEFEAIGDAISILIKEEMKRERMGKL